METGREVYLYAARTNGVEPHEITLVAAHDWDIHGARRAGLTTGYLARKQPALSPAFDRPDVSADSLDEAVRQLLALGG